MSVRSQKVGSEIRKALGTTMDAFTRDHGGGMLTITNVVMSPDLSIAKVYLSVFANPNPQKQILKALSAEEFRFKKAIVTHLRLRIVPELRFYIDNSLDEVDRITQILAANPPFQQPTTESADGMEDAEQDDAEDNDQQKVQDQTQNEVDQDDESSDESSSDSLHTENDSNADTDTTER